MDNQISYLKQKMNFLHTGSPLARRIAGLEDSRGLQPLCQLIDKPYTTIRDQIERGHLRSDFEILIAKRFQFNDERETVWVCWRKGSFNEFKEAYEALHKEEVKAIHLVSEPFGNYPWQRDNMLASLELFSIEEEEGQSQITATLCCQPAPFELGEIAVKGGKLTIQMYGGTALHDLVDLAKERKWPPLKNDAGVSVRLLRGGTSQQRAYRLSVEEGWLSELRFPEGSWLLADIAPGSGITFTFKAFIGDLHIQNPESHSFVKADGSALSEAAKKILQRFQAAALGQDDLGWIDLCGDGLRYVARR
jgi:hypothetical protein